MSSNAPRALIVEDDRSWQQILGEILNDAGLALDVAGTLEEAVVALRAAPHRLAVVDLALSDDDPRNQDGLRVLDAIRLQDPGCAAIVLTGFATVELAVNVLTERGAWSCLRKEAFNRAEFCALVRQALASAPPAGMAAGESIPLSSHEAKTRKSDPAVPSPGLALVVEDDAGWRSILSELLGDAGYQVRLCSGYGEALGRLRRERYALAIIDLSLEGERIARLSRPAACRPEGDWQEGSLDGYRLLASTRAGGVPTIVVSGVGSPEDIERAYAEQGIFAYLQKQTFSRQAFLQAVAEAQAAARTAGELDGLTDRERQVLELLAQGLTNKEIADALVITPNTVKRHMKAIFDKLEVHTRSAAAARAIGARIPAGRDEAGRR